MSKLLRTFSKEKNGAISLAHWQTNNYIASYLFLRSYVSTLTWFTLYKPIPLPNQFPD